jgi:putative ABC transport system ATP-binding protein
MVTHEAEMARYARRLIWMVDGRIERDTPTEQAT